MLNRKLGKEYIYTVMLVKDKLCIPGPNIFWNFSPYDVDKLYFMSKHFVRYFYDLY